MLNSERPPFSRIFFNLDRKKNPKRKYLFRSHVTHFKKLAHHLDKIGKTFSIRGKYIFHELPYIEKYYVQIYLKKKKKQNHQNRRRKYRNIVFSARSVTNRRWKNFHRVTSADSIRRAIGGSFFLFPPPLFLPIPFRLGSFNFSACTAGQSLPLCFREQLMFHADGNR